MRRLGFIIPIALFLMVAAALGHTIQTAHPTATRQGV
jgi:hypothetical protein